MKSAIVFFALVALSHGVPLTLKLGGRIVNGEDAEAGEIPFQISLQTLNGFHFCGGSALNEKWVVTAAHCVNGMSQYSMVVVADTINLDFPKARHSVEKIIVHEDYTPSKSWINDIALVQVQEPFALSKTFSFAPMPKQGEEVPAGEVAVASGWGTLWQGGASPKKLQRTDVYIASQEYCNRVNSEEQLPVYRESHVCAHDPNVETGPCHGDSGGPLTVNGKLVGLASWVIGCASTKHPTVYTRVPEFIDWIEAHAV